LVLASLICARWYKKLSDSLGDIRTLPASKQAKDQMKQLTSKGLFREQRDVWTLGASLGIAYGKTLDDGDRETFQNINSLDPDGVFRAIISGLYPDIEPRDRAVKLVNHAEWGIREIYRRDKNGTLDFSEFCGLSPKSEKGKEGALSVDGIKIDLEELIKNGENEKIEFKSSLCWDAEKKNRNKSVEFAIAKSVDAFLNSEGGFLLIGIKDDKSILGLDGDFSYVSKSAIDKSTTDAFQLHFGNIIENYLGAENGPHVTMRFAEKEEKTVAIAIIPKKAPKEVYLTLDGEPYFFIRFGNSSRPLDVKQANAYIQHHWEKKE
jgi:hypothetical protein